MRIAAVVAALAAILPGHAAQAQEGEPQGCAAAATFLWAPAADKIYRVAAVAAGRNCASANVTMTIRGPAGAILLTFASAAADLPPFADAAGAAAMAAALRRWIDQPATARTTRDLPGWEAAMEEPQAGAAVFHTEPDITRAFYADLRKWGQPIFCFVQGAGREACYALDVKAEKLILIGTRGLSG